VYRQIQKLIKHKGITEYRLAKDIGIHQSTISKWKKGKGPSLETAYKVAAYFGVPVESLFFY